MATVEVLMTSYNRPQYIEQAINSVIDQTYTDWHLTILDDGSNEQTIGVILRCLRHFPGKAHLQRFFPSLEERRASVRYCTNINWGAAHTQSKYLAYLVDDDWWLPTKLERSVALLEEGHDAVYGAQELYDERIPPQHRGLHGQRGVLDTGRFVVDHNSVVHTRESFEKAGGWPEHGNWRWGDADFWGQLAAAGYKLWPVDGPPTDCKRYHAGNIDDKVIAGKKPWE